MLKLDLKSMSQARLESHNILNLMAISRAEGNKRKTKNGKKCADEFKADEATIIKNDCTTKPSPDGKMTDKEWCLIDPKENANPNWDWCEGVLDYDKARKRVSELFEEEIP